MAIFRREPSNGGVEPLNAGGVGINRDSEAICGFIAFCERCMRRPDAINAVVDRYLHGYRSMPAGVLSTTVVRHAVHHIQGASLFTRHRKPRTSEYAEEKGT